MEFFEVEGPTEGADGEVEVLAVDEGVVVFFVFH